MTPPLSPDGRTRLVKLLLSAFDGSELRRLVRYLPDGEVLTYSLPGPTASPRELAESVVDALEHNDALDAGFFAVLRRERPRRSPEIDGVQAAVLVAPAPPSSPTDSRPQQYAVFLVHASSDKPRVRMVYNQLRDARVPTFFDEASLEPGDNWATEIPRALEASRIAAVFVSQEMTKAWYAGSEIAAAVNAARTRGLRIVPVYLDGWLKGVPYGLETLHGLNAAEIGLDEVGRKLIELARRDNAVR